MAKTADFGDILDAWESGTALHSSRAAGKGKGTVKEGRAPRGGAVAEKGSAAFARILASWERDTEHRRVVPKDEAVSTATAPPVAPRRLPIDAVIDLHGKTRDEAIAALDRFVSSERALGRKRKVLIIHGKGIHSSGLSADGAAAVLAAAVKDYITSRADLGAYGHPGAKDGGTGATWVILR